MNWFKSIWLKVRKANGSIPQAQILIPIKEDKVVVEVTKPKRTRKKKETTDGNTN